MGGGGGGTFAFQWLSGSPRRMGVQAPLCWSFISTILIGTLHVMPVFRC